MAYYNQHYYPPQQPPPPQQHFVAELEAPQRASTSDPANRIPVSPDGGPVFEMSADPAPAKEQDNKAAKSNAAGKQGDEPDTPLANPWPYHGPAGGDDDGEIFSPTVPGSGSHRKVGLDGADSSTGPDRTHDNSRQGSLVSPISPSATGGHDEMVPAPLSIKRPQQQPPPTKTYVAYNPAQTGAGSTEGPHAGTQSTIAYRPYRRPSYVEPEAEAPKPAVPGTATTAAAASATAAAAGLAAAASAPSPPPVLSPTGAGSPYPDGSAPHHFQLASPPPQPPPVPHDSRPANLMPEARPTTSGGQDHVGRPHSKSSPGPPPPPMAAASIGPSTISGTTEPPAAKPEEVVLWPPQPPSAPGMSAGTVSQVPPPQANPHPQSAPTSAVSSPHPASQYGPAFHPPPPPSSQQPTSPSTLGFVPQPTYSSPAKSSSPHPSVAPHSPQAISPQSPPPPYSQAFPTGAAPQSLPPEKPSLFPRPPPPSSSVPPQQPGRYPTQPTYTGGSTSLPTSAQPSPHGPPSPYQQPSPHGAAPPSPYQYSQYGQSPPPPHGQPTYAHPPQQQYFPHQPQATPPMYGQPPPQHGGSYSLAPPPLPPRPSSAHSYGAPPPHGPPPMGFSPVPPVAYPPPPKTHYVPAPVSSKPPGPPHGHQVRPTTAGGGNGKLFGSSVAKKWLDKTNQFVENKVEEMLLHNPGDPRYRPQQGGAPPPLPPNHPGPSGQPQQHYPAQQPPAPFNPPNTYQQMPQHRPQQWGGHGYGMQPPGR